MRTIHDARHRMCALVWVAGLLVVVGGTSPANAAEAWPPPLGKEKIIYLHGPWGPTTSMAFLSKTILEQMGYKVEMKQVDAGLAYAGLAGGTGDTWLSGYLPGHQSYVNKYEDKLDLLSIALLPSPSGLVVPAYMPVKTIEDLKKPEIKARLGGKIIGIDPGSGLQMTTEKVVKAYGLDYELLPGSAAAMFAAFRSAYTKGEWIVVTGWCPTAMCVKYDLKFLEDPKRIYGEYRNFHVARRGFRTDFPRATVFLSRFTLYADQLAKSAVWIEDGLKSDQIARRFMEENPELMWYWVGDLIPNYPKPASLK